MPKSPLARFIPHLGRLGRATRWRRTKLRPRVWAHRGDSAHAPENTMLAFEQARDKGADGIELDVRLDGEGNVVVFHDEALERLAGRGGTMAQLSATDRKALRVHPNGIGSPDGSLARGEPVPLLAEVIAAFDFEINVEIKSERPGRAGELVAAVSKVIAASGRADQILVSSFDPFALVQMHAHQPDLALALIFEHEQSIAFRKGWVGSWIGASLLHPQHTLCTAASVHAWHTAGMPVNTWTVDDEAELKRLALLGVDGVFANDVAHAVKVFSEL